MDKSFIDFFSVFTFYCKQNDRIELTVSNKNRFGNWPILWERLSLYPFGWAHYLWRFLGPQLGLLFSDSADPTWISAQHILGQEESTTIAGGALTTAQPSKIYQKKQFRPAVWFGVSKRVIKSLNL